MQTRRDQLHAYRFLTKRAQAALVAGEPNLVDPPMRRLTIVTVSGVMVAILVAAGFAIFGFVKPSVGDSWKDKGSIIVERETGARYVYIDGKLHPALNYASAVLAVSNGSGSAKVVLVDRSDLNGTPRGATIGTPGLPDELPSAGKLIKSPWTVCSDLKFANSDNTGALNAVTSVHIGTSVSATALAATESLYVQLPGDGARFLVYRGVRHQIASDQVASALQLSAGPITVSTAFVNALPVGTALQAPKLPNEGEAAPPVDGKQTAVGDVVVDGSSQRLVTGDGLSVITPVERALFEAAGGTEVTVSPGSSLQARQTAPLQFGSDLPSQLPQLSGQAQSGSGACAVFANLTNPTIEFPSSVAGFTEGQDVGESALSEHGRADEVDLQPGGAAFVTTTNNSAVGYLVAIPGKTFALNSDDVVSAFGYGSAKPATVTPQLITLLPPGPALTPESAGLTGN